MVTIFNSPTGKVKRSKNLNNLIIRSVTSGGSPPINNPPVWNTQPSPAFSNGVVGFYDVNPLVSDADGDFIQFSINDSSPNLLPTGITWGSSIIGDGTNYLDGGDISAFASAADLTVEVRVKSRGTTGTLVSKGGDGSAGWDIEVFNNGSIGVGINDGTLSAGNSSTSTPLLNDGSWHMITMTIDRSSDELSIYIDGIIDVNSPLDISAITGSLTNTDTFKCFADGSGADIFDGLIGEVRIWDTARTPTEILNNHNVEIVVDSSVPGLRGYWKMTGTDEGSVTTVQDETIFNNDLTDTGAGDLTYEDMGILYYDGTLGAELSSGHIITLDDGTDTTPSGQFGLGFNISVGDGYPRLSAYRIGNRDWGNNNGSQGGGTVVRDETEFGYLTDHHMVVVNAQPARGNVFQDAFQEFIDDAKAANPDLKIYIYSILNETGNDLSGPTHDLLIAEDGPPGQTVAAGSPVSQNCWYARDGQGNLEETFPGTLAINLTEFTTADASGRYFGEAFIDDVWPTNFYDPFGPTLYDGVLFDVVDHRPRENGLDYSGINANNNARNNWNDGTTSGGTGEQVANAYREGQRLGLARVRTNYPTMEVGANATTWPLESTQENPRLILNSSGVADVHPEYEGLCNATLMEGQVVHNTRNGFVGMSSDGRREDFGTPRMSMNNYLYLMRHTIAPKYIMNHWHQDTTSITNNPVVGSTTTSDAMAVSRFMLCSTLQDDGHAAMATGPGDADPNNDIGVMDEYGIENTATTGLSREWLGSPTESPLSEREWDAEGTDPWISVGAEIYKRLYQNGAALVRFDKPGGSSGDVITGDFNIPVVDGGSWANGEIPGNIYKEITGFQDVTINAGRTINEINFPSGYPLRRMDGRVIETI